MGRWGAIMLRRVVVGPRRRMDEQRTVWCVVCGVWCVVCGVWCVADDDSSNDGQLCISSLSRVFLFHGSSGIFLRLVAVGAKAAADWVFVSLVSVFFLLRASFSFLSLSFSSLLALFRLSLSHYAFWTRRQFLAESILNKSIWICAMDAAGSSSMGYIE
eukprot:scaffold81_cov32-Attheya_sp.AAC.1